ncbi:trypsin-like peptidase domain-containing protein [Solirubrobacter ginsenosidimutans]|uniref:Trypsin-like peptidase domain-containing protein n=1 Tax=Solirubrobacter ginsenosidimutans TaxID=490573 RepID=A0A9X3MXE2_9ACTN|nr:trypsin-like peptidase domain-containing protein [Solirubrobacter ginsenosidimutans]MDA0164781.1 trypsin-like peptidase domain-containing protein [Solirubrobacter ginsenosidimutans]
MKIYRPLLPLAAAAVIGGGAGAVATNALNDDSATTVRTITNTRTVSAPATSAVESPHDVYQNAKDSVAYITTQVGTGSGFVVSDDGYLVTNAHVVEGANGQIKAKIGDGKTLDAKLVGQDASTDLALLKVDATNLKPLALGDSSTVQVGDPAYAIGNPFGLDRTLTTGVISALQRQISSPNGFSIDDVLQTDAAINPGNSGGPLFNAQGQVIGVNSQIESTSNTSDGGQAGNVGIGFAIPSNTVKSVVSQLRASGKVAHAYLGVQTQDGSSAGAQVAAITSGGPAATGGLQTGDVITSIGGKAVADSTSLSAVVDSHKVGDQVQVQVTRNGAKKTLTVKLGQRPDTTASDQLQQQDQQQPQQTPDVPNLGGGW